MSLTEYRVGDKAIWNAGRKYEQARIIKLLEETMLEQDEPVTKDFAIGAIWAVNEAIALIKEEK